MAHLSSHPIPHHITSHHITSHHSTPALPIIPPSVTCYWRDLWSALSWAVNCQIYHLSSRSFQIYRALRPTITREAQNDLLECLLRSLSQARSNPRDSLPLTLEILVTLQSLVRAMPASKLILFPQIFWAAVALLHTDYDQHYLRPYPTRLSTERDPPSPSPPSTPSSSSSVSLRPFSFPLPFPLLFLCLSWVIFLMGNIVVVPQMRYSCCVICWIGWILGTSMCKTSSRRAFRRTGTRPSKASSLWSFGAFSPLSPNRRPLSCCQSSPPHPTIRSSMWSRGG